MRTEEKTQVQNGVGRLIFVGIAIVIQAAWIVFLAIALQKYSIWIQLATTAVALLVVLRIYGKHTNAAFKMPWIMLILVFPVFGLTMYLMVGNKGVTFKRRKSFARVSNRLKRCLHQDEATMQTLYKEDKRVANQCHYAQCYGSYPVYNNTEAQFFATAEEGLQAQLKALSEAEHFIFMEYYAIEDSTAFHSILDILKQKIAAGVEVRIMYDDIGSIGFINKDFIKRMQAEGINCRVFNPLVPLVSIFMNNRDHRKLTVVDGKVAFTGGYNLADEYFNLTHPYGQWKDTGVQLTGNAAHTITQVFLEMWNTVDDTDRNYKQYFPDVSTPAQATGYVQPYADNPLDNELMGENVYMNIIKNAQDYVYFTTPYLIISDELARELGQAAKRGVDVRIITPGIPDKRIVYSITRSYYANLVNAGVRIFEYTPGFIHSKQCISDDTTATVGTINLDWRSLYLHFEDGVFLYKCSCIQDIKRDFKDTFDVSCEVTEKYKEIRPLYVRIYQCLLRLISPLM